MTYIPLLWMLTTAAMPSKAALAFSGDHFTVTVGARTEATVPINPVRPPARDNVAFRSDSTFVTWDERGLTVRVGNKANSTRLKQIPTSPRLRDHDAIVGTVTAVRRNKRSLEASALSGSRRLGKSVYLLVRWEDGPGRTWLEALVSIDLSAKSPTPKAIAVLPGISFSSGAVADSLFASPGGVGALIHAGPDWGCWTYHPDTQQADFHRLGTGIEFAAPVSPTLAAFVEKTDRGTFQAGTVDLESGTRSDAAEAATHWKMLDTSSPPVAEAENDAGRLELLELTEGAVFLLPDGATVRRAGNFVLVWQGGQKPQRAWLYDPLTWRPAAWWRSSASAKPKLNAED